MTICTSQETEPAISWLAVTHLLCHLHFLRCVRHHAGARNPKSITADLVAWDSTHRQRWSVKNKRVLRFVLMAAPEFVPLVTLTSTWRKSTSSIFIRADRTAPPWRASSPQQGSARCLCGYLWPAKARWLGSYLWFPWIWWSCPWEVKSKAWPTHNITHHSSSEGKWIELGGRDLFLTAVSIPMPPSTFLRKLCL